MLLAAAGKSLVVFQVILVPMQDVLTRHLDGFYTQGFLSFGHRLQHTVVVVVVVFQNQS